MAAFAAVSAIIAVPTSAQADAWGPDVDRLLFHADSAMHTYCITPGFDDPAVAHEAMFVLADTTNMARSSQGTCTRPNNNSDDVWWWSADVTPRFARGKTTCRIAAAWDTTGRICESFDIEMDFEELDFGPNDPQDRAKTACHELGHSVGLQHGTPDGAGSCMINGEIPNTNVQYRRYSTHHRESHINVRFSEP